MPNTPSHQDLNSSRFEVDLFSRTVTMRANPACQFFFYEYVHASDWHSPMRRWVEPPPKLLPGPVSQFAAAAKQAALMGE